MKRVRVKPRDANDKRIAKKLERCLNSPIVREALDRDMRRLYVNAVLYGPDRTRWPS